MRHGNPARTASASTFPDRQIKSRLILGINQFSSFEHGCH
jgi:hypothetical protein